MANDEHLMKILGAGQMNWFQADKVTLSAMKTRYYMEAKEAKSFLYFRKGEDWLKNLVDALGSVADGPDEVLKLANACGSEATHFVQMHMDGLMNLDSKTLLEWYLLISKGTELAKKYFPFVTQKVLPPFVEIARRVKRHFSPQFRILCTDCADNREHLPMWRARKTKVRFYPDNTDAGSHRFYLHKHGYAVFWRQGQGQSVRFYGFEGTNSDVVTQLKGVFEEEWRRGKTP